MPRRAFLLSRVRACLLQDCRLSAPPSSGVAVRADLRSIGGLQAQAFYDDGPDNEGRKLRLGATEYFDIVLVEGVAAPV